ncbi:MAG: universal stress protein [Acidobacteria bacterium]|nr:universal stress protein [Acidobacteriota bacterium]
MRRILLASDFSKASVKAFATAASLARTSRATLMIVHVFVPFMPAVPEEYLGGATLDRLNADARRSAERQLAKAIKKAKAAGVRAAGLMMEGEPARQIVRAARSKHADLIVVGTHGRTGLSKFFVGSVAQRVVLTAPVSSSDGER